MGKLFPSTNFSVFGFDLPDWVKVACKVTGDSLEYLVKGERAYVTQITSHNVNVQVMHICIRGSIANTLH